VIENVGKRLVECIIEAKKWPKSIPRIADKAVAHLVAGLLIQKAYFHRSEKVDGKKGFLRVGQFLPHTPTYLLPNTLMHTNITFHLVTVSSNTLKPVNLMH
jgi:hypothetical protein